jgi:hypothetical protein
MHVNRSFQLTVLVHLIAFADTPTEKYLKKQLPISEYVTYSLFIFHNIYRHKNAELVIPEDVNCAGKWDWFCAVTRFSMTSPFVKRAGESGHNASRRTCNKVDEYNKLCDLCMSYNIFKLVKFRIWWRAGHVARMGCQRMHNQSCWPLKKSWLGGGGAPGWVLRK